VTAVFANAIKYREEFFSVMRKYHFLIALFVVALDRVTKIAISRRLSLHDRDSFASSTPKIRARRLAFLQILPRNGKSAC